MERISDSAQRRNGRHPSDTPGVLADALELATLGLYVFPAEPGGKSPLTGNGHYAATTDLNAIRRWFRAAPRANIGVACHPSGVVVLDEDARNGGGATRALLEAEHGELPETWHSLSGSGGGSGHRYYRAPSGVALKERKLGPGVDVKANGYVIAPPSVHPNGRRYVWAIGYSPDEIALAPLCDWITDKLRTEHHEYPVTPHQVADGVMGATFNAAGWIIRPLAPHKVAVRCPWEREHTAGHRGDSSSVVFAPMLGRRGGWFHCRHEHCQERTQAGVLAALAVVMAEREQRVEHARDARSVAA